MKKNEVAGHILLGFKTYYKAAVIEVAYRYKDRHTSMEQIKSPEINPYTYGQLTFDKGVKKTRWGKQSFQQMVLDSKRICFLLFIHSFVYIENELAVNESVY